MGFTSILRFGLFNQGSAVAPSFPISGLTSYFRFDEVSGTIAYDSKGTYNGTMQDATIRTADGKNNYGMLQPVGSDTSDNRIQFASRWGITSKPLSFSFWIKKGASWVSTDVGSLFHIGNNRTVSGRGVLCYFFQNNINVNCYNSVGSRYSRNWTNPLPNTDWYHVVITITDYNDLKLYVNGTEFTTYTDSNTGGNDIDLSVNQSDLFGYLHVYPNSNQYTDEFAVWNRVITQDEVTEIYNSGAGRFLTPHYYFDDVTTLSSGLTTYYAFEDNTDSIGALDLSTGSSITFVDGKYQKSMDFDGTTNGWAETSTMQDYGSAGTIACWLKMNSSSASEQVMNGGNSLTATALADQSGINIQVNSGTIYCGIRDNNVGSFINGGSLTNGTWYHVIYTWNGTARQLLINNVSKGTPTHENLGAFDAKMIYGKRLDDSQYGDFNLDEVGYWNRVLSATEITQLYASGAGAFYNL